MLVLTRKVDESITIGNDVTVTVLAISGNQIKIGIKAPRKMPVHRTEVYLSILEENIRASRLPSDVITFPKLPSTATGSLQTLAG